MGKHAGEQRLVSSDCKATVGVVSNSLHDNRNIGKAGISRHMGIRPTTRALATNPCDHPAGGKNKKNRKTPWGKVFMGVRTRDPHKKSHMMHLTRHAAKALVRK
jgi:large subunit ribosomal protein L2